MKFAKRNETQKILFMKKTFSLVGFIILLLISACTKENLNTSTETNYLIFGDFYGECFGSSCVETYKLTDSKLYKDANDDYNHSNYTWNQLTGEKFIIAKDLADYIPNELLTDSIHIYGCPDCRDQGGLYIEYVQDGLKKSWLIDTDKGSVPPFLHPFMDEIKKKIAELNK
jgi:hypothetical protein